MRTTLDLPEKLVKDAMEIAHVETKTKVIVIALLWISRARYEKSKLNARR